MNYPYFVCGNNTYASLLGFRGSLTKPAAKRLVGKEDKIRVLWVKGRFFQRVKAWVFCWAKPFCPPPSQQADREILK